MAKSQARPRFSEKTFEFLIKASRQKNPEWLKKNQAEYESAILLPLKNLASELKTELSPLAPNYHFPQKGIGRIKRSATRVEKGGAVFKDWLSYSAAVPRVSRFEHNPNLFFLINPLDDDGDRVLVAGGLYMPSSKQMRAIREAIATDASAFEKLFKTAAFKARFPGGFSLEKKSSRVPAGFDPRHPKLEWIQLQAFFVWRPYSKKEFFSSGFASLVTQDCKQILKMNALLEEILAGKTAVKRVVKKPAALLDRLDEIEAPRRNLDF